MASSPAEVNAIAVLDDRAIARRSVIRSIEPHLPANWRAIECPVLPKAADYPAWIARHNVAALVTDQRLDDQLPAGLRQIDYKGSDVVGALKRLMPSLPIAVISSYKADSDLKRDEATADYVFARHEFTAPAKAPTNIRRLLRQGEAHVREIEHDLAEISDIAKIKCTTNRLSAAQSRRLRTLQRKIGLPLEPTQHDTIVAEIEAKLNALEDLENRATALLERSAP